MVIGPDQRVQLINKRGAEIFGLKKEEIIGKNWFDNFVPKRMRDETRRIFERLMEGRIEEAEFFENPILTKGGEERIIAWHNTVLRDNEGRITGTLSCGDDITERKRMEKALRESEKKYRELFDSIRDGINFADLEGRFLDCNQALSDMLGYSKEEIKNVTYHQVTPKKWHEIEEDIIKNQVLVRGYSDEYEKEYIRKDGTAFPISIRVWLRKDEEGKPMGTWAIIRDITEQKRIEQKMREFVYRVNGISPGECYIHRSRDAAYKIFTWLVLLGVPGLCFAREKPEKLLEYGIPKERIVIISSTPLPGFETIDDIQHLTHKLSNFLENNRRAVVILDGLGYLISRAGFETIYRFLQEMRFRLMETETVLLLPVDLNILAEKERAILTSEAIVLG